VRAGAVRADTVLEDLVGDAADLIIDVAAVGRFVDALLVVACLRAVDFLADCVDCFVVLVLADAAVGLAFAALRAGAFSVAERLTIGFGCAEDLPVSERFFAEAAEELWRAEDLFTPLRLGSLIRSPNFQKFRSYHQGGLPARNDGIVPHVFC
jgi:hypothetical protein